jgi:GGDEF domain-containing protein
VNIYIVIAILSLWFLYAILIKITKKRKYNYNFILCLVSATIVYYFYYTNTLYLKEYNVVSYVIFALFSLLLIFDNIILLFHKNVSGIDFHTLESNLEYIKEDFELLRHRFISTIELLDDGIAFRDSDFVFGTDKYIEICGLTKNEFSVEEFEKLVVKEDLVEYNQTLQKLTKKYPTYSIKYRVQISGRNEWISEKGKMILLNGKKSYISIIKRLDIRNFPSTEIDVLNNLLGATEMHEEMLSLQRHKKAFHFVIIQLTNIPKINEQYGRDFGDLIMGEYLSKIRFKFIKDNRSLFRLSGIKFGLIIKDSNKFMLLDRALVGAGELFNMKKIIGGVSVSVFPNIGISECPYDGKNIDVVLAEAQDALKLTLSGNYENSFCFYHKK